MGRIGEDIEPSQPRSTADIRLAGGGGDDRSGRRSEGERSNGKRSARGTINGKNFLLGRLIDGVPISYQRCNQYHFIEINSPRYFTESNAAQLAFVLAFRHFESNEISTAGVKAS